VPYFVYPADLRPPPYPDARTLLPAGRIEFTTETEAVDHACALLKAGKFVAAVERPNGSLIGPAQLAERCNPLARFDTPAN
jgi:hypothetical protein